jgi:hypothetical protein
LLAVIFVGLDRELARLFQYQIDKFSAKTWSYLVSNLDEENRRVIHSLQVDRKKKWTVLAVEAEIAMKKVLNECGVIGTPRLLYYNCGRRLFSKFMQWPERVWDKIIQHNRAYFVGQDGVRPEVLDKIIEAIVRVTKEIKYKPVVVEGGGQKG